LVLLLLSSTIPANKPIAPNQRTTNETPIPISFEFFSETFHPLPTPSSFSGKEIIFSHLHSKNPILHKIGIQNSRLHIQPEFPF